LDPVVVEMKLFDPVAVTLLNVTLELVAMSWGVARVMLVPDGVTVISFAVPTMFNAPVREFSELIPPVARDTQPEPVYTRSVPSPLSKYISPFAGNVLSPVVAVGTPVLFPVPA
jgi:hypothetical protein